MDKEQIRQLFQGWRNAHARSAWKPVTSDTQAAGDGSRFGGSPWMRADEEWPACRQCKDPMQFFLQLSLESLPAAFEGRGKGLLQLFYCSRDDGDCETWSPFSGTHVVRLRSGPGEVVAPPAGLPPFPARSIVGWTELRDYPGSAEHDELGLAYEYDFRKKRVSVRNAAHGVELRDFDIELGVEEAIGAAESGDKLGGWPAWIQGVEYPTCPECGQRMALVFQLDSEDNIPHMFGDVGCGHITQCRAHPGVLAFGWACG